MGQNPSNKHVQKLKEVARKLRLDILEMTTHAGSGHPSSSFSAVEILTVLYFGGILRYRPQDPWWNERDRFIMSKGHAAPLLYAVLARAGYFESRQLMKLRQLDSPSGCPTSVGLQNVGNLLGAALDNLSHTRIVQTLNSCSHYYLILVFSLMVYF